MQLLAPKCHFAYLLGAIVFAIWYQLSGFPFCAVDPVVLFIFEYALIYFILRLSHYQADLSKDVCVLDLDCA
jgi:hypothetical protein